MRRFLTNPRIILVLILYGVTLHSVATGLGLIFAPPSLLEFFGYRGYHGRFFQVQGGVFHLVMALAYLLAAHKPERYPGLIILTVAAKTIATCFLLSYYFLLEPVWIILVSGIGDGLMGFTVFVANQQFTKQKLKATQ